MVYEWGRLRGTQWYCTNRKKVGFADIGPRRNVRRTAANFQRMAQRTSLCAPTGRSVVLCPTGTICRPHLWPASGSSSVMTTSSVVTLPVCTDQKKSGFADIGPRGNVRRTAANFQRMAARTSLCAPTGRSVVLCPAGTICRPHLWPANGSSRGWPKGHPHTFASSPLLYHSAFGGIIETADNYKRNRRDPHEIRQTSV